MIVTIFFNQPAFDHELIDGPRASRRRGEPLVGVKYLDYLNQ